jgi:hypothetical protein
MQPNNAVNARLTIVAAEKIDGAAYRREAFVVAALTEETSVAEVQARLTDKFPQISPNDIAAIVSRVYARYEGSRIRDFVPLLVERGVRAELLNAQSPA